MPSARTPARSTRLSRSRATTHARRCRRASPPRSSGSGAAGSVLLGVRADERTRADRELVALKVPDYSGDAARNLSEHEFERLFREEAGALLALPSHGNLARFITFDASVQPK